ncbi:MAG: RagB/SusD family nutrient uptake outer membrane protein [Flavobacteriales bacterium]|nr:RagB/SusD family nutrient uptake outer membrane protein [Flavobacteriales bacterium]NNK80015.1 RagB/SusD family nutrient uptake outer membrane protein [Flavobacteriales bacterium]
MKKSILIIGAVIMAFSCTKLEEEVFDKIPEDQFPENEAQSALRIVPTYQELSDLIDDAGWWFWMQETTSDEVVFPTRLTDWEDGGKWRVLHQHTWDNNTDGVNSMWSHMYDGVSEANRAIDELLPFASEPSAQTTIAKLKTLRSFYYYLLIDNYGDVPYVTSFFNAEDQPSKTDRATIHANIVADLEESLPLLPSGGNKFAVSKAMAYTLLAKLHINAEVYTGTPSWSAAEAYCDSVMMSGLYNLESSVMAAFATNNTNSFENIFTIPFDEFDLKGFRLHMRTLHYLHNLKYDMIVGPWNGFAALEDHYNTYTDDDLRKEWFIVGPQFSSAGVLLFDETAEADLVINPEIPALVMDASYSFEEIRMSGARVQKYEIAPGTGENLSNDFPVFRYADVLLMKAECAVRIGGAGAGDMYINEVRSRAGLDGMTGADLDMILEERGRELFCEGHRRQDLIRFGKFNDAWWEKAPSDPSMNTFPIPQWAIDANPNLN